MKKFRQQRASGEDDVTFLDGRMAKIIVDDYSQEGNNEWKRLPFVHLYGLKKLTLEAAQVLSKYHSELYLPWRALQGNPMILQELSKRTKDTIFMRVGEISLEMAAACNPTKAKFILQHVDPCSKAVLEEFKQSNGKIFVYNSNGEAMFFENGVCRFGA